MFFDRPELEKGSRKFICPQCGKKTFTRYVQSGQYINDAVGLCDRSVNCGYHKPPKEWKKENPDYKPAKAVYQPQNTIIKPIGYIPMKYVFDYAKTRDNNLIYYLMNLFSWETIKERTDIYFLGSTNDKAVIFWQIDENGKCRTGKVQQYDEDTGKRIKNTVNWIHAKLKLWGELPQDFNMQMCLFGLHLIRSPKNASKTICICESEKTAVIASCCYPEYIWMAAGALHWLNVEKLKPLKGRNIILFPDTSLNSKAFDLWSKIADKANRNGLNVVVSDLLESVCTDEEKEQGFDIADYLVKKLAVCVEPKEPETKQVIKEPEIKRQSTVLSNMIKRNPALNTLIDVFGLVKV